MIEKLRFRHSMDLPTDGWQRNTPLLAILGSIAVLFVLVPLGLALYAGLINAAFAIAVGVGALLLVLLVGAIRGKPGHARR